jgi:hypothetical protein
MRITKAAPSMVLIALFSLLALSGLAAPATAQTYPPPPPVQETGVAPTGVAPAEEEAPGEQPGVEAEEAAALAFTGAELTILLAAFALLLGGGAAALIAARRRNTQVRTSH